MTDLIQARAATDAYSHQNGGFVAWYRLFDERKATDALLAAQSARIAAMEAEIKRLKEGA